MLAIGLLIFVLWAVCSVLAIVAVRIGAAWIDAAYPADDVQ